MASPRAALLNLAKPAGPTSHDVVAQVRRASGQRKVGHAGTLDPLAEGVVVLGLGAGTRVLEYVQEQPKAYRATVRFGLATSTLDSEGEVTARAPVPLFEEQDLEALLQPFIGRILQTPPRYSAIKLGGEPLYARTRRGEAVEPQAREVEIYELQLLEWRPPLARLAITCGKGTYIRSLARDIGEAVGSVAHLAALVRTRVGRFELSQAVPLDEVGLRPWEEILHPIDEAVRHWPAVSFSAREERVLNSGGSVPAPGMGAGSRARAYGGEGGFFGLVESTSGGWRPLKILTSTST